MLLAMCAAGAALLGVGSAARAGNPRPDAHSPLGEWETVPTQAQSIAPSLTLEKTVGANPALCADARETAVVPGSSAAYCYQVTNTGGVTLTQHDLVDSALGAILSTFPYTLAPGAQLWLTRTAALTQSTINTATWTALATFTSTLTVSATDSAQVHVLAPASPPYCAGFESGALPASIGPETTESGAAHGLVQVSAQFPHTGAFALDIATDCDGCGGFTRQAAILAIDLAGVSEAELDFWVRESGDENDPEDGVFASDDGGRTWALIQSLNNFPLEDYVHVVIDLDAAASGAGMSLVDGFLIKFQSFDNHGITGVSPDGYSFDDVCVRTAAPDLQVSPPALSRVQFANQAFTETLTLANAGTVPLDWTAEEAPGTCSAPGDLPWITLSPAAGTIPAQQAADLAVGFHSRGLAPGNYDGNLCVTSDDPDEPLVSVPLDLTVLPSPQTVLIPDPLMVQQPAGEVVTYTLTLSNPGTAALNWTLYEGSGAISGPLLEPRPGATRSPDAGLPPPIAVGPALQPAPDQPEAPGAPLFGVEFVLDDGSQEDGIVLRDPDTLNEYLGVAFNRFPAGGVPFPLRIDSIHVHESTTNLANREIDLLVYADYSGGNPHDADLVRQETVLVQNQNGWNVYDLNPPVVIAERADILVGIATRYADGGVIWPGNRFPFPRDEDAPAGQSFLAWMNGSSDPTDVGELGSFHNLVELGALDLAGNWLIRAYGEGGCAPEDVPWLVAQPATGATGAGESSEIQVKVDSTGLTNATYTGGLCLASDDPTDPLVEVPVTLTVGLFEEYLPLFLSD